MTDSTHHFCWLNDSVLVFQNRVDMKWHHTTWQAREKPRIVRDAFGERVHDEGLVAPRKPEPGRPSGGRHPEEKDGGA